MKLFGLGRNKKDSDIKFKSNTQNGNEFNEEQGEHALGGVSVELGKSELDKMYDAGGVNLNFADGNRESHDELTDEQLDNILGGAPSQEIAEESAKKAFDEHDSVTPASYINPNAFDGTIPKTSDIKEFDNIPSSFRVDERRSGQTTDEILESMGERQDFNDLDIQRPKHR